MKKLLSILLASVLVCSMMAVSCEKDDIRDKLNPIEVKDLEGTLEISDWDLYLKDGHAKLYATYCDADGLYRPEEIKLTPGDVHPVIVGNNVLFEFTVPGSYTVSAGNLSIPVKVMK